MLLARLCPYICPAAALSVAHPTLFPESAPSLSLSFGGNRHRSKTQHPTHRSSSINPTTIMKALHSFATQRGMKFKYVQVKAIGFPESLEEERCTAICGDKVARSEPPTCRRIRLVRAGCQNFSGFSTTKNVENKRQLNAAHSAHQLTPGVPIRRCASCHEDCPHAAMMYRKHRPNGQRKSKKGGREK